MLDVTTVLRGAAERVEQGWTQGGYARNERGHHCGASSKQAVAWCMTGAVRAELAPLADDYDAYETLFDAVLGQLLKTLPGEQHSDLLKWNDAHERRASDVQDLLLRAAEVE